MPKQREPDTDQGAERTCRQCGARFHDRPGIGRGEWARCCGDACQDAAKASNRRVLRQLKPGEPVPLTPPHRYRSSHGYIRLRWTVSPMLQVETYEHRVVDGVVTTAPEVHHINHDKTDNRRENLLLISAEEHAELHRSHPVPRRKAHRKPRPFQPKHDMQRVRALTNDGLSQSEIAIVIGCAQATVSRYLARLAREAATNA